jgi:hypothetical protein
VLGVTVKPVSIGARDWEAQAIWVDCSCPLAAVRVTVNFPYVAAAGAP